MHLLYRPDTNSGTPRRPRWRPLRVALFAPACLLAGCASYEAVALDPGEILAGLERIELPGPREADRLPAGFEVADGLSAAEAAALAVTLQPELRALRAEAGVAAAELVEAGLLPDPDLSWDAMDWIIGGTRDDALSGLGLMFPLPRPGEIAAQEGVARARIEELRWRILEQEWRLQRDVHMAFLTVEGVFEQIALSRSMEETAAQTHDFFARARAAGAATALQENLARIELEEIRMETRTRELELELVRQDLNRLIGLPPDARYALQTAGNPFGPQGPAASSDDLTAHGVERRPDLKALLAGYAQAEEALRLEVARQWPTLALGTGIEIVLPIFSRLNAPAIATAEARRARLGLEVEAAIHRMRSELHAAVARFDAARAQADSFRRDIQPQLEESLRLTRQALERGEVTPVEILSSQRQVLNARRRDLEVRIDLALARSVVDWATGEFQTTEQP